MRRAVVIFSLAIFALPVASQDAEAVRVVDRALEAVGGETKIRTFRSIYFSAKGFEDSEVNAQPFLPGRSSKSSHEEKLAVFLDGRRLAYELKTDRGDGTTRHRRFYFPDTRRVVADFVTRSVFASPIQYPSSDRDQDARRIPHAFLLEVGANMTNARHLGSKPFAGREHDVITISLPGAKVPVAVYFDKQSGLMSKYEFETDFPGLGRSTIEYTFEGYRPHATLGQFHSRHEIRINGKVFRGLTIDAVAVDSPEADDMLRLPPDLEGSLVPTGTVKEIAKGVYFVYGVNGFQPMFIEFADHIMAIEAPSNVPVLEDTPVESVGDPKAATELFIQKIKQTVPNKPIKYVVVTHAHADHYGGLGAFIRDNPTIITTAGNRELFEKFVPQLKIEIVERRRTFADIEQSVDLMNVGRNPHTEENLIAYLPKPKFLFQGDLFYFNNEATFPPRDRMTVMPFFAKWLKEQKLAPERIYGFHSTMFGTMEHIEKILKLSADKAP